MQRKKGKAALVTSPVKKERKKKAKKERKNSIGDLACAKKDEE